MVGTLKEGQWLGREVNTDYVNSAFPAQLELSLETTNVNKYTIWLPYKALQPIQPIQAYIGGTVIAFLQRVG